MSTITTSFLSFLSLTSRHKSKSVPKSPDVFQRTRSKGSPCSSATFCEESICASFCVFIGLRFSSAGEKYDCLQLLDVYIGTLLCTSGSSSAVKPTSSIFWNQCRLFDDEVTDPQVGGWSGNDDCLGAGLGAGGGYSSGYTG